MVGCGSDMIVLNIDVVLPIMIMMMLMMMMMMVVGVVAC